MADPVSIACGVAQFVGLAAQAANGIAWLRRRFREIKGAPKVIRRLYHELKYLENTFHVLSPIEQDIPEESRQTFVELMELLAQDIEAVSTIILDFMFKIDREKPGIDRVWKSIVITDKKPELDELLRNLEKSKSTIDTFLSGVNVRMTSNVKSQIAAHSAFVEPSLQRIETNLSMISTKSDNIFSKTIQIEQNIEESAAKIMRHIDDVAKGMREDIPRLIEEGFHKYLDGVTKDILQVDPLEGQHTSSSRNNIRRLLSPHPDNIGQRIIPKSNAYNPLSAFKKRTFSKTFPLPIGFIQTKVTRSQANRASMVNTEGEDSTIHIEITLVPYRWLSSRGRVISLRKMPAHVTGSVWGLHLRSYNIIPHNSMVIQACKDRDLEAIQMLFKYRQASPYDVDVTGRVLMSYVWNEQQAMYCGPHVAEQASAILKFLTTQGFDPAPYVHELLKVYRFSGLGFATYESSDLVSDDGDSMRISDEMLRFCLEHSDSDPFMDRKVLLSLWQNSLGGDTSPPLDSSYLFQEDLAGLDDLVFELPDQVFCDIMSTKTGGPSLRYWLQLNNQSYETLVYLCRGGQDSIKSKVFNSNFAKSVSRLDESQSCYCPTNSTHLLFLALHNTSLSFWPEVASRKRKHVRRLLVECLRSGEDPEARCACRTSWQSPAGYRSVTDVAAAEGLLGVWESALWECGFDATRIIDEGMYDGLSDMFDMPQRDTASLPAPFGAIGQAVYLTLSSIV